MSQKLFEEFESLKTDEQKWKWVLANQDKNITIYCDNDDTYGQIDDYPDEILQFNWYIGWSDGIFHLLKAVGIKAESV